MANKERGEVGLDVDGTRYTLRPTLNALCELEDVLNQEFHVVVEAAAKGRLSAVRALVWSYLQEYHADEIRTLKDAARWIERAGGLDVLQETLDQLMTLNAGEASGDDANPPTAQESGNGASSSSLPNATASETSGPRRRVNSAGALTRPA
jgi:hypothetical protein